LTEEPFSGSKALALMRGLVHGWLMENVEAEVKRKKVKKKKKKSRNLISIVLIYIEHCTWLFKGMER